MSGNTDDKSKRGANPQRSSREKKFYFEEWSDVAKYMDETLNPQAEAIRTGRPAKRFLFRGTTDARYKLVPTVGREGSRISPWKYNRADERALLRAFKLQVRPYLAHEPANELEWLAIARHHGVPTRLLDWTTSFLIALFFAVENGGMRSVEIITRDENGKVIREQKSIGVPPAIYVTHGVRYCNPAFTDPFRIRQLSFFTPPHISPHIAAQRSILAIHPDPKNEPPYPNLRKLTVKPDLCVRLKFILEGQGITHGSIVPTIDGLAQQLQWAYKWNLLDQYRMGRHA